MGMLWRMLAPRPAKRMRRAVYRAANPVSYITPRPIKQVRRAAFNVAHPWEMVERGLEDAIVAGVRGSSPRSRAAHAGQSLAATFEEGYAGTFAITPVALDDIVEHARAASPALCCGLIGDGDDGISVHRGTNMSPTPTDAWGMTADEIYRLKEAITRRGGEIIALYHSLSPSFARNLDYLTEDSPLVRGPFLLCFASDPPQFRVFDAVRGGLAELKIELLEEVEGYPELELFLETKANGGRLALPLAELLKRFAGTYDDLEDLDELLADAGFGLAKPLASTRKDEPVDITLDNPPLAYELRFRVDQNQRKGTTVGIFDLLDDLGRKRLTDPARDEILDALDDVGLACDEDALAHASVEDRLAIRHAAQAPSAEHR